MSKKIGKVFYLPLSAILFLFISCNLNKTGISDLRCEYMEHPVGIDSPNPRFSWKLNDARRGVYQKAYRLIVGESMDELNAGTGNCWDSGITESRRTVNIEYEGTPLKSDRKYFWKVCIWANDDSQVWSKTGAFHTGLLNQADWEAQWVTTQEEIVHAAPIFRKTFVVEKRIKQAYAFVSACGFYEFYLNGGKVGDHVLEPAITDYRKTVLYSTYDVTNLLRKGDNVAGVILGNGAYNMRNKRGRYSWSGNLMGNSCFMVQINITYTDGSRSVIKTDGSWKYDWGAITFNNLFGGEDYDAAKEPEGWLSGKFKDDAWMNATLAKSPGGVLRSQSIPPIKVTATLRPIAETHDSTGVYLFDLGQNIAGWWRLHVKGRTGQTIRVRGAETLNNLLFPKPLEKGDRLSTNFNYFSQVWTDYTLKGNESEVYEPRFFYSGFRYIEVTTSDRQDLSALKVEGRAVRSSLERNGSFVSSDSLINQIHRAGLWSQMGNLVGYPTDCPHREKGAYGGDGQVVAETSMHDFQMAGLYTKWLNDMRDAQEENGRIPNTAPTLVGGMGGGVGYGSAYILIPWWMYHYYGDVRVMEEHYEGMKKYVAYLRKLGTEDENPKEPFIIDNFVGYWYSLGEWQSPGMNDCPNHAVVNTFYYYYDTQLMAQIADILGHPDDAVQFRALGDTIKQAFNRKFFNTETLFYGMDKEAYQTYQLVALVGDLVPEQYRQGVLNTIIEDIRVRDNHLNTGIVGTKYLWPILVGGNQGNLAYEVATQTTYPGYGYWIRNGSTTLVENWSGERSSHNHEMFGSITEYFYKYLAGIQSPMEGNTSIGYRHIHLQPCVPDKLQSVSATLETAVGTVVSDWKKNEGSFHYRVSIPANATATVVLPVFDFPDVTVSEGSSVIWRNGTYVEGVPGITDVKACPDRIEFSVGSGNYVFNLTPIKN